MRRPAPGLLPDQLHGACCSAQDVGGAAGDGPKGKVPGSILFVCSMNSIRSPMAEKLTRMHLGNHVFVQSAGIHQGEQDGFMHAVMEEVGIDMHSHMPRLLDDLEDNYFDLVVTLSPQAHHRALEMTRSQAVDVEYWPIFDPSTMAGRREQVLQAYRDCRDQLEAKIRQRFVL